MKAVANEHDLHALVADAGLGGFVAQVSYLHAPGLQVLALKDIQPPTNRTAFDRERALSILSGVKNEAQLPPIEVERFPDSVGASRTYRLHHGFHRYHLSLALGFTHIPAVERPYFDYEL